MKALLFTFLMFAATTAYCNLPSLVELRAMYKKAPKEKATCTRMLEVLEPANETNNPLYTGYKACATMIMAKHASNPFSKMSWFKKGKKLLEKAIASDANNVELRLLRYTVQFNAPGFLGYKDNMAEDKAFLSKSLPSVKDLALKDWIERTLAR